MKARTVARPQGMLAAGPSPHRIETCTHVDVRAPVLVNELGRFPHELHGLVASDYLHPLGGAVHRA